MADQLNPDFAAVALGVCPYGCADEGRCYMGGFDKCKHDDAARRALLADPVRATMIAALDKEAQLSERDGRLNPAAKYRAILARAAAQVAT